MIWLFLSILCSTLIFINFKLFDKYGVNNLQAIVMNYFIACAVGIIYDGLPVAPRNIPALNWFPSAVILGFLFITLFQVMALVSQKIGVSVVSVAVKMSLVIPVVFVLVYYHEKLGLLKGIGIFLALIAVYLATRKKEKIEMHPAYAWLPILLFIGSGFLDAFLKFNQHELIPPDQHSLFTSASFGMAAVFGVIFLIIRSMQGKIRLHWKNIVGGITLGIPNYGSIYFLLRALEFKGVESSVIFPVNNVGIVALSVLAGTILFKEKLSTKNIIGIVLSIVSILLIAFENIMYAGGR